MKLVLDTNVVLELLHWRDPRCAPLALALTDGRGHCVTDPACLAELERVLAYPQFALAEAERAALLAGYRALAECLPAATAEPPPLPRCRDADDQKFVELAARCGADLLVTRDRELLKLARRRARPAPFAIVVPEAAGEALQNRHLSPENPA